MAEHFASRLTAMGAPACVVLLLLAAQSACTPAHSRTPQIADPGDWVLVDQTEAVQVHVDRSTLKREGERVRSQLRLAFRTRGDTPGGKPYDHQVDSRVDDCRTGGFAIQATAYRRTDGSDVEVSQASGALLDNMPGTRAAHLNAEICKLAGLPAPVYPSVSLKAVKPADWRLLGPDPKRRLIMSVLIGSAKRLDDTAAEAVARLQLEAPASLEDGRAYQSLVVHFYFQCEMKIFGIDTVDYYSASGTLLQADLLDMEQTIRTLEPGSPTERLSHMACAGLGAKAG